MLYKFCNKKLDYVRVKMGKSIIYLLLIIISCGGICYSIGRYAQIYDLSDFEKEILVLTHDEIFDKFEEDKLTQMLGELNVKFPHIAVAQSILETNHWKSNIFSSNNNLFGMRQAKSRITTANGSVSGHACYNHWRESVYDYAFYQASYLSKIKTEKEYFNYLSLNYAEDSSYVSKLKTIINTYQLKEKFNN
jgi:hypothetical protein